MMHQLISVIVLFRFQAQDLKDVIVHDSDVQPLLFVSLFAITSYLKI